MPSSDRQILLWVSQRPPKLEVLHFAPLANYLKTHGIDIEWFELKSVCSNEEMGAYLQKRLVDNVCGLFCSVDTSQLVQFVVAGLRSLTTHPLRLLPVFWLYEHGNHRELDRLLEVGCTDFCHASTEPHELLWRLRLRMREFQRIKDEEQRTKQAQAEMARSETILKQREEFLSVCAHDLRSPLGLIQSSAGLILKNQSGKATLSPAEYELLNRVKRQATQAVQLVTDLLDVMAFEQGLRPKYQLFPLHDLLVEFYGDYRSQAETKGITLHYDNHVMSYRVLADADRVRQLLQNLVMNALKFTQKGKNIYLTVKSFQGRRKADPAYPMIVIGVKDEGVGIPQREMQRIFDRFAQIKDHSKPDGRGLGLTVARQISQLHDGNLWVESEEGSGSTFHVLFPHVVSRTATVENIQRPERKCPKILVIEAQPERQQAIYGNWEAHGCELIFAKDGVDAMALLFHELPDACVLNTRMEKLDPMPFVEIAKADLLTNTIPMLLALEDSSDVSAHIETPKFDRVFSVPVKDEELKKILRSIGKHQPALSKAA